MLIDTPTLVDKDLTRRSASRLAIRWLGDRRRGRTPATKPRWSSAKPVTHDANAEHKSNRHQVAASGCIPTTGIDAFHSRQWA
jgi:hypothetical protein